MGVAGAVHGLWHPLLYLLVAIGPTVVVLAPNLETKEETWSHDMPVGGL